MSNNFSEVRKQQEVLAGAQFDKDSVNIAFPNEHRRNVARASFIKDEIAKWFVTVPLYESISVQSYPTHDEIRDEWFNGSITVYAPKRDVDWHASTGLDKFKYKIVPGYINASSWQAGSNDVPTQQVQQELQHRLWMMGLAIDCLNARNQLCLEWEPVQNPMRQVLYLQEQLDRYVERERVEIQKQNEKIDARKAKKSA